MSPRYYLFSVPKQNVFTAFKNPEQCKELQENDLARKDIASNDTARKGHCMENSTEIALQGNATNRKC